MTRRALGEAAVAGAAALVPAALLAPSATLAQTPPDGQRDWLAEARQSRAAAQQAIAKVPVAPDVEPAFRFRA